MDLSVAAALTASAMCFARLGSRVANSLDARKLKFIFGLFTLTMAPMVPLKHYVLENRRNLSSNEHSASCPLDDAPGAADRSIPDKSFQSFTLPSFEQFKMCITSPALLFTGTIAIVFITKRTSLSS